MLFILGNCLQMPQLQVRIRGLDESGRLKVTPSDPDLPWHADCLTRCKVMKVKMMGTVIF